MQKRKKNASPRLKYALSLEKMPRNAYFPGIFLQNTKKYLFLSTLNLKKIRLLKSSIGVPLFTAVLFLNLDSKSRKRLKNAAGKFLFFSVRFLSVTPESIGNPIKNARMQHKKPLPPGGRGGRRAVGWRLGIGSGFRFLLILLFLLFS